MSIFRRFSQAIKRPLGLHGQLIAHKLPSPAPVEKAGADTLTVNVDETRRIRHGVGERTEGVRIADNEGLSVTADLEENGTSKFSMEGKSPPGEKGNLPFCQVLVEAINRTEGARGNWGPPVDVSQNPAKADVDCEAHNGRETLKLQVVRSEVEPSIWQTLNNQGRVQKDFGAVHEVADRLRAAIEIKEGIPPKQRAELVLALRADPGLHAFREVVTSFIRLHGDWARSLGFKAIWIVGPTDSLTRRLT